MGRLRIAAPLLFAAVFATACSSTIQTSTDLRDANVGQTATKSVDAAGGTLSTPSGGATLTLPAGALATSVALSVTVKAASTAPNPNIIGSAVYDFGPTGTVFSQPVSIAVQVVTPPTSSQKTVLAYLDSNSVWQAIAGSTVSNGVVTGQVTHFTDYAAINIPSSGAGCAAQADPNAFCTSPLVCISNVCGTPVSGNGNTTQVTYRVGGTVSGLTGTLVLQDNGGDSLTVSAGNSTFTFSTALASQSSYAVTVQTQPAGQTCQVSGATGTVGSANVSTVSVVCTTNNTSSQPTLQSITVTPTTASVAQGETQQFAATGAFSDNSTAALNSNVVWTSSNTAVATVSALGLASGVSAGSSTITAAVGAISGTAALTVPVPPSTAKQLTSFEFLSANNVGITADVVAEISGTSVTLTVPYGTDVTALAPTVLDTGVSLTPASGIAQDFSTPVIYTVTAGDASTAEYTVTVNVALSSAKSISAFSVAGVNGVVSGTTISVTVPFGTSVTSLAATVQITGASVSPASGLAQDFTSPVTYTVTAADNTTQTYTVTVNVASNTAKSITSFVLLGVTGSISGTTIGLTLPFGTDVTALAPTIATTGASVSPASGVAQDFTQPVTYTVTAGDNSVQAYTVAVTIAPNSAKDINSFAIGSVQGVIVGTSIVVTMPYGTDVTALTPTIGTSGASTSPLSGVAQDFTSPVTYTVTAADMSTQVYTVTVNVALNNVASLTALTIDGVAGVISGSAISVTLPFGTDVTALMPSITITGASVSPASGVAVDLTSPATYTVTAQDGVTTNTYTVTVIVAPNMAASITDFNISGVDATISGGTISLTVPYGTNVTTLAPTVTFVGSAVSPASGAITDFTSPVTYTVTAADGVTTASYTVTVAIALNSAASITSFAAAGAQATISSGAIALTVPYGTDVTTLAPIVAFVGATVSPANGAITDFTNPVTYTVTAADGVTTASYTVTVTVALNPAASITDFNINGVDAIISAGSISLTVPYGTDVTTLAPTVTFVGASVSPASGATTDFTNPVTYTVTADDGVTTAAYTVTVSIAPGNVAVITGFAIGAVNATITGTAISLTVPYATDVTTLAPTVTFTGSSVSPASGAVTDFTNPVTYTVTALDGTTTAAYTVTVSVGPSNVALITDFSISWFGAAISGNTISLTVPSGTNLTTLAPKIAFTGASVSPASGASADFTNPVTYTVTAADGVTTAAYTVTVTAAASTTPAITDFNGSGVHATFLGNAISLIVPYGIDPTTLNPEVTFVGSSISPANGTITDFTNPVTYTVTAADGVTTAQYTVTVTAVLATVSSAALTDFEIIDYSVVGTFYGNTVTAIVPYGSALTGISPFLRFAGASISPDNDGIPSDFTNPVVYTVSSIDGTATAVYTAKVQWAPGNVALITDFNMGGIESTISGTSITLTVPYGIDVTQLAPTVTFTGSSVSPASGDTVDFTNPVTYTVTSLDGTTTAAYTVTVIVAPPTNVAEITDFKIGNADGSISSNAIAVTVPYRTDVTNLAPVVTIIGSAMSPASGVITDFTNPVTYTVTSIDGTVTSTYTVTVTVALDPTAFITSFAYEGLVATVLRDSLVMTVENGMDVTALAPTVTFDGASVSPASNSVVDFTNPVTYTVSAVDGFTTTAYSVTVAQAAINATDVSQLTINGLVADIVGSSIALTVPYGTDPTQLQPFMSTGAYNVNPEDGFVQDFTNPVDYAVTASDRTTTQVYSVHVNVASNTAAAITDFNANWIEGDIVDHAIHLTMPYGTDIRLLRPNIQITGSTVSPVAGVITDFTNPVTYTVTAADNATTQVYTVTADVAAANAAAITGFQIYGVNGVISGTSIAVTLPYGTDVTQAIPIIAMDGAQVAPLSGLPADFTNPVAYTVTSADQSVSTMYTATVTVAAQTAAHILSFSINGIPGTINSHAITVNLPPGTDKTQLTPRVEIDGATVSPSSGVTTNFSSPVTYTVKAGDGSTTQAYTVTVNVVATLATY